MSYPWQKVYEQHPTIAVSKVIEEAPALQGFNGSWAASYTNGLAVQSELSAIEPGHSPARVNKIGLPGLPEINFAPYSANTNRFGTKGPSLIGHPISYSVVGPTVKSQFCDWQWVATNNFGTPLAGDVLTLDTLSVRSYPGTGAFTNFTTIQKAYGFNSLTGFDGGLYVVVSQTGETGVLPDTNDGGLWDGYIANVGGFRAPVTAKTPTSRFEIFRVTEVAGTSLTLDPDKRLATYFNFAASPPTTNIIRAVTLIQPKVARLMGAPTAVPPPTVGRERVFLTVAPETAATSDLLPPYGDGTTPGSWLGGRCDPFDLTNATQLGTAATYSDGTTLPIPLPLESEPRTARAEALNSVFPVPPAIEPDLGTMTLVATDSNGSVADVGKIIHIYEAETRGTIVFSPPQPQPQPTITGPVTEPEDFLGWYEILDVEDVLPVFKRYVLRRITQVDPTTGRLSYGLQDALVVQSTSSVNAQLTFHFTIHEPISELFTADPFDSFTANKMASARLVNLIDPEWVARSTEEPNPQPRPFLADSAIFDTVAANPDPGSMLDLGFRMVLYPAKEVSGDVVPDFENPIYTTLPVVLDPTKPNEPQFISVDYASGVVTLSHPPLTTDPLCEVAPNGIVGTGGNNPRGELVLFASFVPYSLEEGQRGASVRVTGLATVPTSPIDPLVQADVFSDRVVIPVVAGQTITSGTGYVQTLRVTMYGEDILPETGFFELLTSAGEPAFTDGQSNRASTFGYTGKRFLDAGIYRLYGVWGGGIDTVSRSTDGLVLVIRRDALLTRTDFPFVPYQQDVSYGGAKRSSTIRFAGATVQPHPDGSVEVALAPDNVNEDLFRSWVLSGGTLYATNGGGVDDNDVVIAATRVLFQGSRFSLAAGNLTGLTDNATHYIYVDSTSVTMTYTSTTTLPLPESDDILIGKLVTTTAVAGITTDLRYPLADVDKRLDIIVGVSPGPGGTPWTDYTTPHFETLGEAVAYASEIMLPSTTASLVGPAARIRVVGGTVETGTIPITTDGLVIEGSPRVEGEPAEDPIDFAVSLDAASNGPLFDLGGHSDLAFRDLSFYFQAGSQNRYVFTSTVQSSQSFVDRVHVENCRVFGDAHGFVFSDRSQSAELILTGNETALSGSFGTTITPHPYTLTWNGTNTAVGTTTGLIPGNWLRLDTDGSWYEIVTVNPGNVIVQTTWEVIGFPTGATQSSVTTTPPGWIGTFPGVLSGDLFVMWNGVDYFSSVISERDATHILLKSNLPVTVSFTWYIYHREDADNVVWRDSSFIRNEGATTDFGIYLGWITQNCRFEDNIFQGVSDDFSPPSPPFPPLPSQQPLRFGAFYVRPDGFFSDGSLYRQIGNQFKGNHVFGLSQSGGFYASQTLGYERGIDTYGYGDVIVGNHIEDTRKEGIYVNVPDASVSRDNHLENIWGVLPDVDDTTGGIGSATGIAGNQPAAGVNFNFSTVAWVGAEPDAGSIVYLISCGFYRVVSTTASSLLATNMDWPTTAAYLTTPATIALPATAVVHATYPKKAVEVAGGQDMIVGYGTLPDPGWMTLDTNKATISQWPVTHTYDAFACRVFYVNANNNTTPDDMRFTDILGPRITHNTAKDIFVVGSAAGLADRPLLSGNQVSNNIEFLPASTGDFFEEPGVFENDLGFNLYMDGAHEARVGGNAAKAITVGLAATTGRNSVVGNRTQAALKVFGSFSTVQGNAVGIGTSTGQLWHDTDSVVSGNVMYAIWDTTGAGSKPTGSIVVANRLEDGTTGWYGTNIPAPSDPSNGFIG